MSFANPPMLWIMLATLPLLVAFLWWSWRRRQQLIRQFVRSRLLAFLTVGVSRNRQKIRLVLQVLTVAFLLLALARPRWGFVWEEARQKGLDIVVVFDTSRSMLATDLAPNRLARAKLAVLDLIQVAKSDRLGLVPFAGTSFLMCPLTFDDDAFRQSVDILEVDTLPQGGTALAGAIDTALTAFREGDNYKAIVLMTDGEDHENGSVDAAAKAAATGVRVFTIGVGTVEGEVLPEPQAKGGGYIKDDEDKVVKSRLNEPLLQSIATSGHGFYLPLRGAQTMETLYARGLSPLLPKTVTRDSGRKGEPSVKLIQRPQERFQWPLALALVCLVVELFVPDRKPQPRAVPSQQPLSKGGEVQPRS
jgi:Ca-activated chloride channel homolog